MKLNASLIEYSGYTLDELPEELLEQLNRDPELKAEFEAQARMADLMELKNYEQPDEAMFGRVQHRVTVRLKQSNGHTASVLPGVIPGWARLVAMVMFMLGLSVVTHLEMSNDSIEQGIVAIEVQDLPDVEPWLAADAFEMPADPFAPFVLRSDSVIDSDSPFVGLTEQLERDFEFLGLGETNQVDNVSLIPVLLTPDQ